MVSQITVGPVILGGRVPDNPFRYPNRDLGLRTQNIALFENV